MSNNKNFKILFFIIDITFILLIALSFYLNTDVKINKQIFIPKGSTYKIVSYLSQKGYEINKFDVLLIKFFGMPQSGWIDIKEKSLKKGDFLWLLTHAKTAYKTFALIPGQTTYFALKKAANKLHYDFYKLMSIYNKNAPFKDGVFFAQTYQIPLNFDEEKFILYLLKKSLQIHKKLSLYYLKKYNQKQWFKIVSVASIIQKESANKKEMPLIASVIYNRLKRGMKLQMDGALNYGKFSNTKITPQRIKNDNTQFNTYKFKGLPPYPVCIVCFDSIKAALQPAKTNYLYFVRGKDKKHIFSKDYKTHLKNIKNISYKKELR